MTDLDLDAIRARIADCQTYNFGMRNADQLAHVDAPALLAALDAATRDIDARFAESDHLSAKYYQRMRDAEKHARMRASESADLERERDELAAVIEALVENSERLINSRDEEWVDIDALLWDRYLSNPADALRRVKAQAWGEGYAAGQDSLSGQTGEYVDDPRLKNPYREGRADD